MSEHLVVSRRGIVHVVQSLANDAATACGKGSRDLVLIGAVGIGERMCHSCSSRSATTAAHPGGDTTDAKEAQHG